MFLYLLSAVFSTLHLQLFVFVADKASPFPFIHYPLPSLHTQQSIIINILYTIQTYNNFKQKKNAKAIGTKPFTVSLRMTKPAMPSWHMVYLLAAGIHETSIV